MKNKFRLLVMDLDGTLLDSKEEISEATAAGISAVNRLGIKTAIATGRVSQEALFAVERSGVEDFLIEMNGGKITDLKSGEVLYEEYFDQELGLQIADALQEQFVFQIYTDQGVFCTADALAHLETAGMSKHYLAMFKNQIQVFTPETGEKRRIFKFLVIEKDREALGRLKEMVERIPEVILVESLPNYYEIVLAELDKMHALRFLCDVLEISPKEILAIGDSDNDRKMLDFAGTGVVLANGSPALQKEIGNVFPSNDDEGVLKTIEAYIIESV